MTASNRCRPYPWLALVLALGTALRVWAAECVGFGYGEAYYFSCAQRPSAGYIDHPPLAILLGRLGAELAHASAPLAYRAPFIVLFAATSWLLFRLAERLFGADAGLAAAIVLNLAPVFSLSTGTFFQPDGPLLFFWLATTCQWARILFPRSDEPAATWRNWAASGFWLGLALLSKYTAALLPMGLFFFFLSSGRWRRNGTGLAITVAIALTMFLPVLFWNSAHHWISFRWQGERGAGSAVHLDWLLRNIGGQALWLYPWIALALVIELAACWRAGPRAARRWFIFSLAIGPVAGFTLVSAWAPVGFHFHWQAPGYLLLLVPLGARLMSLWNRPIWRPSLVGLAAISMAGMVALGTHAATGWWRQVGPEWLARHFGENADPTLECLDFAPLAKELRRRGLVGNDACFLCTNRWFLSAKVETALGGAQPVHCLNHFDPRGFAYWAPTEPWVGRDAILIGQKKYMADAALEFSTFFEQIEPIGVVDLGRGGGREVSVELFRCRRLTRTFPRPYGHEPMLDSTAPPAERLAQSISPQAEKR